MSSAYPHGRDAARHLRPSRRRKWRQLAWASWAVAGCAPAPPPPAAAPPRVTVAIAQHQDVTFYVEAVGTLDGFINAELRARVRGFIEAQAYKDGAFVAAGELMFRLDAREYEAARAVARGSLKRALAAQARYTAQVERYRPLAAQEAVSRQDLDDAVAAQRDAAGQVESARGTLARAELNLSFTEVRSPLAGLAGTAQVRTGNLVGQDGATLLATVSQLDPMRATFPLSEVDYLKYHVQTAAWRSRDLLWARAQFAAFAAGRPSDGQPLEMRLADGSRYPHAGVVVSANRQVDQSTGTIQIQALFPNPDLLLRPGQYCRLEVRSREVGPRPLMVPERALREAQGAYVVGVVGADNQVALRTVKVGPSAAGLRVVTHGLDGGERVVVDGLQRLRDGARVQVDEVAAAAPPVLVPASKVSPAAAGPGPATPAAAARPQAAGNGAAAP